MLLTLFVFLRGGLLTSAEIRLDTGDLRYRYLGIPLQYERMPEPQRSQLIALAANSTILRSEWHTCASYPLRSSNNTDLMCRGWYNRAAVWVSQDPQLTRLMLEDVASYIATTNATAGLPASSTLLSGFYIEPGTNGQLGVKPGWRQTDDVLIYAKAKGYSLPLVTPNV